MTPATRSYDFIVIGGGFYGCCLALFLRSISQNILLIEAADSTLTRASRVNQARVHTGFHYPRSVVTASRSAALSNTFAKDFPEAVVDNFQMLYAIARRRSKVSANRFFQMFTAMHAPIQRAGRMWTALFDSNAVEDVLECREFAFDYSILQRLLFERLVRYGIDLRMSTSVETAEEFPDKVVLTLSDGSAVTTPRAFNVTYSQINQVLRSAGLPLAPIKHEYTEIALIKPPGELDGLGITVMDGPFFSTMPYPAEKLYSLTHVRYTPHFSWTDASVDKPAYQIGKTYEPESRVRHMILDAQRFLPCLRNAQHVKSIYDIKSVLLRNERDDGRPILFQRKPSHSRVTSIMGGKIDNIYDLFMLLKQEGREWSDAHDGFVRSADDVRKTA
jgi:glycine/D-amino acid oxidase-like deaminating enzyme